MRPLAFVLMVIASAVAVGGFLSIIFPGSSFMRGQALCDKAVPTLLHSTDLTEITRAGIIINGLDCSIRRRLEKD